MTVTDTRIPLTVIGGYLGAGKTTLLNHLLRQAGGRRLAVLVNDFGRVNIDAELVSSRDGDTITLTNGCVCCSLAGGFVVALTRLRARAVPPEHVIVEASGVSDPYTVGRQGDVPGFRIDAVVVVADADVVARARDEAVTARIAQQLRNADIVVLNKVDLVTSTELEAVCARLRALVPSTGVIAVRDGCVPMALLLHARAGAAPAGETPEWGAERDRGPGHESWSYAADEPLSGDDLRALAAGLPRDVLRVKGIVYLRDDPMRRFVFQLVGKRWSLDRGEPWGVETPCTRLTFIGLPGSTAALSAASLFSAAGDRGT